VSETSSYHLLEAEVGTNERQWDGNSEPESEESHKRAEWHGGTAAFHPQDQIQHEEHAENDPTNNSSEHTQYDPTSTHFRARPI